jgi:outer membrane protein OmpA-like peptidoglycan-associated protein
MFLGKKVTNIWPAYTDIMFMLFILALIAALASAASYAQTKEEKEQKLEALENKEQEILDQKEKMDKKDKEIDKLQKDISKLEGEVEYLNAKLDDLEDETGSGELKCGLADTFLEGVMDDLQSRNIDSDIRDCSLVLHEGLLFAFGEYELTDPAKLQKAQTIMSVILNHAEKLTRSTQSDIDTIVIEGHGDCRGEDLANHQTGYARAMSLYFVAKELIESSEYSPQTQKRLLAHLSARSFGKHRPLADSNCHCTPDRPYRRCNRKDCARNRRVEIFILGKVGRQTRSWQYQPADAGIL